MYRYLGKKILMSCFLFLSVIGASQSLNNEYEKKWFIADKAYELGDYMKASKIYKELLVIDEQNEELNYKQGVCYFNLRSYRLYSWEYFQKVTSEKYLELNYYLGCLYHLSRDYVEAINQYELYKKQSEFNRMYSNEWINDLILKSRTAQLYESKPNKDIQIENMEIINSNFDDYAPKINTEGNILFFTSRRKNSLWTSKDVNGNYYENIYYSKRYDEWSSPEILSDKVNSAYNDACTGISFDGQKMLFFRTSEDLKSGDIYETYFDCSGWTTPNLLNCNVNSEYVETSACYSPDGRSIYFSSDRPGGYGGKDLYVVKMLPNGEWGEAYNLGPEVNTQYDENMPFVHPSGATIFFSSQGHENMGGYDIFSATFDEFGKYTTPINIGYPINTNDDDVFFVLNTTGDIGYLSSDRRGGQGGYDIYKIQFTENKLPLNVYKINVFNQSNQLLKKVEINLYDLENKIRYGKYKSNEHTGKMIVISEPDKEYEITIQAEGYLPFKTRSIFNANNQLSFTLTKNIE